MIYFFDGEIASIVGVNAAVIFQNIGYWAKENEANGRNFHDGRYWTYNSQKAYKKLFPFMTVSQIRGALDKLSDADLILIGCYNEDARDRTAWYALSDIGKNLWERPQMQVRKTANGDGENNAPLPYINTDINKKEISKDISKEKHPTLEEVRDHIKAKGYHFSADEFYNYYSSANWHKANGQPVRSWKQCCVTWESNNKPTQTAVVEDHRKRLK